MHASYKYGPFYVIKTPAALLLLLLWLLLLLLFARRSATPASKMGQQ